MADATFGVKVPEELKEALSKMMQESGLTGKDFMQSLINVYQVEKTKEQLPEVAQELKELQVLTQRINNIYLNLGYRIDNMMRAKDEENIGQLRKKEDIISELQKRNEDQSNEIETLKEAFTTSVNHKNDLMQRVNELTNMYDDNKALVEEYKSKNDMLTGMLKKYEKYPEEVEQYRSLLSDSQSKNIELNNDIARKNEELQKVLTSIEELKKLHKEEIVRIKEQNEFNIDKAILAKDREYQDMINNINNKNNNKVKELLEEREKFDKRIAALTEENNSKNNKINDLEFNLKKHSEQIEELSRQLQSNKIKK